MSSKQFHFTTSAVAPREQASYWQDVATKMLCKSDFKPQSATEFKGDLWVNTFEDFGVSRIKIDACEVTRSARHVAADGLDFVFVMAPLSGEMKIACDQDYRATIRTSSLAVVDMEKPGTSSYSANSDALVFTLPRVRFGSRLKHLAPERINGVERLSPVTNLAMTFFRELAACAHALTHQEATRLIETGLDLLLLGTGQAQNISDPGRQETARAILVSAINAHLENPELKPRDFAAAAGFSARYANKLLSEMNTSLEDYVFTQRLLKCKADLENPAYRGLSISEIAYKWGFSDAAHFSRRFKTAFGVTPTTHRALHHHISSK